MKRRHLTFDGKAYAVSGIPDVDRVSLQKLDDHAVDATFTYRGRPVLGYRAVKYDDGRSLTMVSVDPAGEIGMEVLHEAREPLGIGYAARFGCSRGSMPKFLTLAPIFNILVLHSSTTKEPD